MKITRRWALQSILASVAVAGMVPIQHQLCEASTIEHVLNSGGKLEKREYYIRRQVVLRRSNVDFNGATIIVGDKFSGDHMIELTNSVHVLSAFHLIDERQQKNRCGQAWSFA